VTHPRAGETARAEDLVDLGTLLRAYYERTPDPSHPAERVMFGTSGHRGSSLDGTFTEAHILAITQAVCRIRREDGVDGPLFLGADTHALSAPAAATALEVLAANGVDVFLDARDGPTPTPVVCHAVLNYNRGRQTGLADGLAVTPSHNPPEDGGFKYHTTHGGVAGDRLTERIGREANRLLEAGLEGVRRMPHARALAASTTRRYDYLEAYVGDLGSVLDLDFVRASGLRLLVDPMGGAGVYYWSRIAERYGLELEVLSEAVDPTFAFMSLDHDGRIRLDPSSSYALRRLLDHRGQYDVAFACDTDHDRHGIVIPGRGLMPANHFITAAADYLLDTRSGWPEEAALGTTVATTRALVRVARRRGRAVYETPVGFKWFAEGLYERRLVFGGEESAGASFLRRDGGVWTTDKDGIAASLLAAEMTARRGRDPATLYRDLAPVHGSPVARRWEFALGPGGRERLLALRSENIPFDTLGEEPVRRVLTHAPGNGAPIGGIKIETDSSWLLVRPSGTERVCKVYAETDGGEKGLGTLHEAALSLLKELVGLDF
jgi:phosphoglucomutase